MFVLTVSGLRSSLSLRVCVFVFVCVCDCLVGGCVF